MSKINSISAFLVILISANLAMAQNFKGYQALSEELTSKLSSLKLPKDPSQNSQDTQLPADMLINGNLNKFWKKPALPTELKTIKNNGLIHYSEGTGTRGGGSGLLVNDEIKLLEIFRSENLETYNLFFPIDQELRKIENKYPIDMATQIIFETVLSRIASVTPNLADKINVLYQVEIPFQSWIPIYEDLPLIEDEVAYPLEPNKLKIQIASRRTKLIMYNTRAYAAMNALNRAALWLHEYLYALGGLENSIKTQRAVSLFFSSDFLTIAKDESKLTLLFFELDLLGLSRKTIDFSIPPGAKVSEKKQIENCGLLEKIDVSQGPANIHYMVRINGQSLTRSLDGHQASIVFSSLSWAKIFLGKLFPIYKYYGQKIMADKICFDSQLQKVTQVQSALAIDSNMADATKKVAELEVKLYKLRSEFLLSTDNSQSQTLTQISDTTIDLEIAQQKFEIASLTLPSKILFPQILKEYNINIDY